MKLSTKTKIATGAGAALVLAITLGAAGAIAASRVLSDDGRQAVIDDAAKQLGVTPSALEEALKQALKNRVDDAVESGRLTEDQGNVLKERIDAGAAPLVLGGFGHRGFGRFGHFGHILSLDTAASYLGVSEAELRDRLRGGDTLAEIAKAEGKSVDGLVNALVAASSKRINEAVADGRLTEERAAELKQDLADRMTDLVNGEFRPWPFRFPGFERRDFDFHGGPWIFPRPRG